MSESVHGHEVTNALDQRAHLVITVGVRHRLALPERHSDPLRSQAIDGARAR